MRPIEVMTHLAKPRLRPFLEAAPEDASGASFVVYDTRRLSRAVVTLTADELAILDRFDGLRTAEDLGASPELVACLDAAVFLDGPRFRELVGGPIRPPSCIGAYEGKPQALRQQLRSLFANGAGLPGPARPDGKLRGILAPHIDYARGGPTYTHAYKALAERTEASLFVIVATSHYSGHRFTLTRKHFQTPLGVLPTDAAYVGRISDAYGDGLFDDEIAAHLPEHSIELEAVFLQYLFEGVRPVRIVPLLVGSFDDCVGKTDSPGVKPDIARMVAALREAEARAGESVCYIVSGDLAHIGPRFGDRRRVHREQLLESERGDRVLMDAVERGDAAGYHAAIVQEQNARRICGYMPTWLFMEAAKPSGGKMLDRGCYVDPKGKESVSFASAAFER